MKKLTKMTRFTLAGIFAAAMVIACGDPEQPADNNDQQKDAASDSRKTDEGDSDHKEKSGECNNHDDCAPDFYCDKNGTRKCQPQKENGDAVSDAGDPQICKSQKISADGYCCATECENTTGCAGECALKVSSYSCATGSCLLSAESTTPVAPGKICRDNLVIPLSTQNNCGQVIKGGSTLCATTVYYRSCNQEGACRTDDDLTDALSDVLFAPEDYYFASDSSTELLEGTFKSDCTTDNYGVSVSTNLCDGSGSIGVSVSQICNNGCANKECISKDTPNTPSTNGNCGFCRRKVNDTCELDTRGTRFCPPANDEDLNKIGIYYCDDDVCCSTESTNGNVYKCIANPFK